jgi:predicted metallopeptidase
MATDKVYSRVTEAETIVKKLCEKQPDLLWAVKANGSEIAVLGIENKERSEKNKVMAKIKPIKGEEKAILQLSNIPIRYIIVLYYSDWNKWSMKQKQWIILHELLHVAPDIGKTIKHDIQDFKVLVDCAKTVEWFTRADTLPNLIDEDVKFNLDLRPTLDMTDEDKEEGDEI